MNYAEKDQILRDFVKLIKHYSAKKPLFFGNCFDDMESMLTLFLLELISKGKCVSQRYVAISIRNEFYRLSHLWNKILGTENFMTDNFVLPDFTKELENNLFLADALKKLTKKQNEVIKLVYLDGVSVAQIAERKGTTRQSINEIKLRALDKLKRLL